MVIFNSYVKLPEGSMVVLDFYSNNLKGPPWDPPLMQALQTGHTKGLLDPYIWMIKAKIWGWSFSDLEV